MNKFRIISLIIAILFGIFMIVFGEIDDSPGAQGIGLITIIVCIVKILKNKRIAHK